MFQVTRTVVKKGDPIYGYCADQTQAAKRLYNAALFRLRNHFTASAKMRDGAVLTELESQVEDEVSILKDAYPECPVGRLLGYRALEKLMRVTHNPDFFEGTLSMQTAQQVLNDAVEAFSAWLKALDDYKSSPKKYTSKPRMPKYCKSDARTVTMTNQDCYVKDGMLKLPKTKRRIRVDGISPEADVREVSVKPYYDTYLVLCTFKTACAACPADAPYCLAVDFGVSNIAACVTNEGSSLLYKGGAVKAANQWYDKQSAKYKASLPDGLFTSKRLRNIGMRRDGFVRDQLHKISRSIVDFCVEHKIGVIVLGENKRWKQNCNLGARNNQMFTGMPISVLRFMITYKAQKAGITVLCQEESYTSKADFLMGDSIPVYGETDPERPTFSGKRICRGLYRSGNGSVLNADINGAANIMRKAGFDDFPTDLSYLRTPAVIKNIYNKKPPKSSKAPSNPVKRIVAA